MTSLPRENGTWLKTTDLAKVRNTLWAAADELRANSKLTPVQYRNPVLGLVFLAYAENRFEAVRGEVEAKASARNPATIADYKAKSVLYVPDESRLSYLNALPEGDDIGKAVDEAIKAIEAANPELKDILPRGYQKLERSTLIELLRLFAPLPTQLEGDAFGFIYEDFLSNFAAQEGKGGGEYFTPYSIVRLIVEILEPSRAASSIPLVAQAACSFSAPNSLSVIMNQQRASCLFLAPRRPKTRSRWPR